jgi:signal transduction histidine kinase
MAIGDGREVALMTDPLGRSDSLPGDEAMAALLAEVADVLAREAALRRENAALHEALARARASADEAGRVKAAFVAHMSHEIRTPLNAIVGLVEQLLAGALSDEQRELACHVRASGEQMAQMLGGILDLAQIETSALALVRQPFALIEEVERALEAVAPFAAARGVELCMTASEAAYVTAVGDAGRLRQVVFNVIGNAVKFGGAGDVEVRVEVTRAGEEYVALFEVRDHGPGIDPEVLPRLFAGSLGLGLGVGMKLCDRVCALMGGDIAAENLPEGGARVRFRVRLGVAGPPTRDVVDLQGRRVRIATRSAGLRAVVATWLIRWNAQVVEEGGELVIADADRPECTAADGVPVVALGPVCSVVSPGSSVVASVARPVCRGRLGAAVRTVFAGAAASASSARASEPGALRILVAEDNP